MNTTELINSVNPSLIFDIGANIGGKTEWFRTFNAKVLSVEPQPSCVQALHTKFDQDPMVTIAPVGVAAKEGFLTLSICEESNTISTFTNEWKSGRFSGSQWNTQVQVAVTTLDSLISAHGCPEFCKIDVEGFEKEVLSGLSQTPKLVSFEFTREFAGNAQKCLDLLKNLGYTSFNCTSGPSDTLNFEGWVTPEDVMHAVMNPNYKDHGDIYAFFG